MLAGVGGRCWRQGTPKNKQQLTRWGAAGLWELCPAVQPLGRIRPRRRSPGNRQEETGVSWQEAPVQGGEKRSRLGVQKHLFSHQGPLPLVIITFYQHIGESLAANDISPAAASGALLPQLLRNPLFGLHLGWAALFCVKHGEGSVWRAIFILRPRLVILVFVKKIQTKPFMLQSMSSLKTAFPGAKD